MRKQISLILLITLTGAGYLFIRAQDRGNILKFSHQVHVIGAEIMCTDCHTNIESSTKSDDRNFPEKDICANCHDVEDEDNCTLCHVDMENLASFSNPVRNYFFNHKKHLLEEKMECEKCHKDIENAEMGDGKFIPSQQNCNLCHNGLSATMECLTCHPSDTEFRPGSHISTWSREHMVQVRAGGADCAHCHTNNYCQGCHESTDLISTKILPENFYATYTHQVDSKQAHVLKSVHDLNYRFIHQLDAAGKEKNCSTCHETSAFCGECHNAGDINSQVRPAWHGGADWGAIALGVGTGGGRHAALAKRDIERCAACHDVQGADPGCLLCHSDFDGIKNTDPRTHESGFTNRFGEGSEFHHDDGAVCFMCHTNTNHAGTGFCGYCHGPKN